MVTSRKERERELDEAVEDTFPASDPHHTSPPPGSRKAEQLHQGRAGSDDRPKGQPRNARRDTETDAGRVEGVKPSERKAR
jgi:hypothetical protein